MFFPLFLLLAGILLGLEVLGLISTEAKWGLPVLLVCAGISGLVDHLKRRRQ